MSSSPANSSGADKITERRQRGSPGEFVAGWRFDRPLQRLDVAVEDTDEDSRQSLGHGVAEPFANVAVIGDHPAQGRVGACLAPFAA